jgi:hypothetical protein
MYIARIQLKKENIDRVKEVVAIKDHAQGRIAKRN